jgi:hypothetical protein
LGGISYIVSEYINQNSLLMYDGEGAGSLPVSSNKDATHFKMNAGNSSNTTGANPSSTIGSNSSSTTGANPSSTTTVNPPSSTAAIVHRVPGYDDPSGWYVAHFDQLHTRHVFYPINQQALHGSNGRRYLAY